MYHECKGAQMRWFMWTEDNDKRPSSWVLLPFNSFLKRNFFSCSNKSNPWQKKPFGRFSHFSSFLRQPNTQKLSQSFFVYFQSVLISEIVQLIGGRRERIFLSFSTGRGGKTFFAPLFHKIKHFKPCLWNFFFFSAFLAVWLVEERSLRWNLD